LTDNNEIIDRPVPQGREQISPTLRQRLLAPAKKLDEAFPCVARCNLSGG
jgi:hypothetical protein